MALGPTEQAALTLFGERLSAMVKNSIRTKRATSYGPVNASGETERSVEFRLTDNGLQLLAAGHIFVVEAGRRPGKQPPKEDIRRWIDAKGIEPNGISKDSLAFLIARKIGREGTLIHRQGGKSGVLSDILNQQNLTQLLDKDLLNYYAAEVTSQILDTFKL